MGQMTRLGDTLFSFGTFSGPNDFYRPVAWRSNDGTAWEFIESGSDFYEYGTVDSVATLDDSLLAAHATGLIGPAYSLWRWTSDASWRRSEIRSDDRKLITVMDFAVNDDEVLAIGGMSRSMDPDPLASDPGAWRSTDGTRWEEVPMPEGLKLATPIAAVPGGGFVMLARKPDNSVSAWFTADGSVWTPSDLKVCADDDVCNDYSLVAAGDLLVAASTTQDGPGRVWISRDAISWTPQVTPDFFAVGEAIATLNGEALIFARTGSPEHPTLSLLHGTP
jgi:hypothetical protein